MEIVNYTSQLGTLPLRRLRALRNDHHPNRREVIQQAQTIANVVNFVGLVLDYHTQASRSASLDYNGNLEGV